MDGTLKWKKVRSSGTYRRKIQQYRQMLLNPVALSPQPSTSTGVTHNREVVSVEDLHISSESENESEVGDVLTDEAIFSPDDEGGVSTDISVGVSDSSELQSATHCKENEESFDTFLRRWATIFNIPHAALKPLLEKISSTFNIKLCKDPRTLMNTPRKPCIISKIEGGEYWHCGLEQSLRICFCNMKEPQKIHININIDGLPLFRSGTAQFWPILFNIHEMPHIQPMIIGIFYGNQKPAKVEEFLDPFVTEACPILQYGLVLNGFKLVVKIRTFICDSPARAFIKGTVNFNAQHGCLKCCIVGVHSTLVRSTVFPPVNCTQRIDAMFRARRYGDHHRDYKIKTGFRKIQRLPIITPLLKLPIDMIEDIIVADSLHLLHLGVMKRLLMSYKEGHRGCQDSKWSNEVIQQVSAILKEIKLPLDIHRSVRDLKYLNHWKATEFAAFLNYYGIVVLRRFLTDEHYENFLNVFCATTICSTNYYHRFLPIAQRLFENFNKEFYELFHSGTSNTHNLLHVVSECERFGALPTISSYPFENFLFQIKRLLRSGRSPLVQVANRLIERNLNNTYAMCHNVDYPSFKHPMKRDSSKYTYVILRDGLTLTSKDTDKWFLTRKDEIVAMKYAQYNGIYGSQVCNRGNFFESPINSSNIKVYVSKNIGDLDQPVLYDFNNILCKFVAIIHLDTTVFVPLHHTYPVDEQM